ncbi:MAG: RNA polymerase Rpb4 family protein [Thermoprotei archaeon]
MKIISSRNITYAETQKILEDLAGRGVELRSIELRVLDYLRRFNKCRKADELVKELEKQGLNEITAVMIANIVPKDTEALKILLNFENKSFEEESLNEIVKTVSAYCSE